MNERLLTYGLFDGELKHISDVANGLACNCKCAKCFEPLVAKNNVTNRKASHFAHSSGAYETTLHKLAKEFFFKSKKIRTPDFRIGDFFKKGKDVIFEEVLIEDTLYNQVNEKIVADSIGIKDSKKVIIEFANTHFIDEEKTSKLIKLKMPCIEVNLSSQNLDRDEIEKFFSSDSSDS